MKRFAILSLLPLAACSQDYNVLRRAEILECTREMCEGTQCVFTLRDVRQVWWQRADEHGIWLYDTDAEGQVWTGYAGVGSKSITVCSPASYANATAKEGEIPE